MLDLLRELANGLGGFFAGAVVNLLLGWLNQRQADQAREDLGRVGAERDGAVAVGKIADNQTDRAANPPSDTALLDRLNGGTG